MSNFKTFLIEFETHIRICYLNSRKKLEKDETNKELIGFIKGLEFAKGVVELLAASLDKTEKKIEPNLLGLMEGIKDETF